MIPKIVPRIIENCNVRNVIAIWNLFFFSWIFLRAITRMTVHVARDTRHSTRSSHQKYRRQYTCNNSSQLEARRGRSSPSTPLIWRCDACHFSMARRYSSDICSRASPLVQERDHQLHSHPRIKKWPRIIRLVKPLVNTSETRDHARGASSSDAFP